MVDEPHKTDKMPTDINVYGWTVAYKRDGQWVLDQDEEYENLPAHYPFVDQALDRVTYLRGKGIVCRASALLAEKEDTEKSLKGGPSDGQ